MTVILDGKATAQKIRAELKEKIIQLDPKPCLAVVLVGENPSSKVYVSMKHIACEEIGIISKNYNFTNEVREEELIDLINRLNRDLSVHGILVQLPLPPQIDENKIINLIDPNKDVDGFHHLNLGRLFSGRKKIVPCTPKGIIRLLQEYKIEIEGKDAVVVGRSNTVGKPVATLLTENNATVTLCHSKTKDLKEKTLQADILIVAIGIPKLIKEDMVKEGAVVVDVGVNRIEDLSKKKGYHLCGDVDFEKIKEKADFISPVPGGVGPMTVAMLMENTYQAYQLQKQVKFENNETKYGLKLWSINEQLFEQAKKAIEDNHFQYIELYTVPETFNPQKLEQLKGLPVIVHAPHFSHNFNLAKIELKENNKKLFQEAQQFADFFNAEQIIVHPGIEGELNSTIEQLKDFQDKRLVIENVPQIAINGMKLVGYNPHDIQKVLTVDGTNFCLDFTHAIKSAISQNLPYKEQICAFLALKPIIGHISDGKLNDPRDEHLSFGEGDFDLRWIKQQIKECGIEFVTLETHRKDLSSLEEDIRNINYFKML